MQTYVTKTLYEYLVQLLDNEKITKDHLVIVPNEIGKDQFANMADYSDTYGEFNIEPAEQMEPLSVRSLLDSLEEVLDEFPVYVWDATEGGKMVEATSVAIHNTADYIRIY